ncbi:MAG: efflux RND transporter periplasmic adaptor subunit [Thermoanaerobaculum sp.]
MTKRTLGLWVIVPICSVAFFASCEKQQKTGAQGPPPVPVRVAKAEQRKVAKLVPAVGSVVSPRTVQLRPRVGGVILSVHFREGEMVREGQLLFEIDPEPYRVALREAEARLARDEALLVKAQADLQRAEVLAARDFITKEQLDQAKANVAQLKATVAGDLASVDSARLQLSYCRMTAPVSGRVGEVLVHPGNLVKANDDKALVTIVQVQPIDVSFTVPEVYLEEVKGLVGQKAAVTVRVRTDPEKTLGGELFFVDNSVDARTGTVLLKARFDNREGLLWPGQFVDVSLSLGEDPNAIVVPVSALVTTQSGDGVFVVTEDQSVELRAVVVARKVDEVAVLSSGVSPGETVVTDGQIRLVPGARVEVRQSL